MERTLNLNDGWEDIVNDPDRQDRIDRFHAKRLAAKLDKLVSKSLTFALIAAVFATLTVTNALTAWIGTPFAAVFIPSLRTVSSQDSASLSKSAFLLYSRFSLSPPQMISLETGVRRMGYFVMVILRLMQFE